MLYRLFLFAINIFFPPLSVLLVTGPYTDTLVNCLLFLCGVIPSHIHGFYVNCTYFHRRRKVRKGRWPGGPKALIFDRRVWYGGVSQEEAEALRRGGETKRQSRGKDKRRRSDGRRVNGYNDYTMDPRGNSQTPFQIDRPQYYHQSHTSSAARSDGKDHVSTRIRPTGTNEYTNPARPTANTSSNTANSAAVWPQAYNHPLPISAQSPPQPPRPPAAPAASETPERRTIVGEIWRS